MKQTNSGTSVTLTGLLGLIFVVLKLIGTVDWSWWMVTFPFWGGLALALLIAGITFIIRKL